MKTIEVSHNDDYVFGNKPHYKKRNAKISINCGYCSRNKGCEIKLEFRELAKNIEYLSVFDSNNFVLKCPFVTPKYKKGDKVKFTVGYGCHRFIYKWECTWDCDGCSRDNCKNGIIKFKQKRYKGYQEFNGTVYGYAGKDKYIIEVDWNEWIIKKNVFNRYDILKIKSISDKIKYFDNDNNMYFISKQKFIK